MPRRTYAELAKAKGGRAEAPPFSAPDLAVGVERIRACHAFAMERANVLPDSVRLAAEQVQDVRIDMLERGPEVSSGEAFVAALITACLESAIAGTALTAVTRLLLRPVVALHVSQTLKPTEALIGQRSGSKLVTSQLLTLRAADTAAIHARFDGLAQIVSTEAGVPTAKAAAAWVQTLNPPAVGGTQNTRDAGDSPGVSIQEAVSNFASEQRLWITTVYSQLESRFLANQLALRELLELTTFDPIEDFARSRRDYKRFFEAAIWASMFRFGQRGGATIEEFGHYSASTARRATLEIGPRGLFGFRDKGPENLLDYWSHRFIDPDPRSGGQTFAQLSHPAAVLEDTTAHLTRQRPFTYEDARSPTWMAVGRYLTSVGESMAKRGPMFAAQPAQPASRDR